MMDRRMGRLYTLCRMVIHRKPATLASSCLELGALANSPYLHGYDSLQNDARRCIHGGLTTCNKANEQSNRKSCSSSGNANMKLSEEEACRLRKQLEEMMLTNSTTPKQRGASFSEMVTRLLLDGYALDSVVIMAAVNEKLKQRKTLQAFRWFADGCEEGTWLDMAVIYQLMKDLRRDSCMVELYVLSVHWLQRLVPLLIGDLGHGGNFSSVRLREPQDGETNASSVPKELFLENFPQKDKLRKLGYEDCMMSYHETKKRRESYLHQYELPVDIDVHPLGFECAYQTIGSELKDSGGLNILYRILLVFMDKLGLAVEVRNPSEKVTLKARVDGTIEEWLHAYLKTLLGIGDVLSALTQYKELRRKGMTPSWSMVDKLIQMLAERLEQPGLAYEILLEYQESSRDPVDEAGSAYVDCTSRIIVSFLESREYEEAQKVYDSFVKRYNTQIPPALSEMVKHYVNSDWWEHAVSLYMNGVQTSPLSAPLIEVLPILLDYLAQLGQSGLIVRVWSVFKRSLDTHFRKINREKVPQTTISRLKSVALHSIIRAAQYHDAAPSRSSKPHKNFQDITYVPYRWRIARPVPNSKHGKRSLPSSSVLRSSMILDPNALSTASVEAVLEESFVHGPATETLDILIMLLRCIPAEDVQEIIHRVQLRDSVVTMLQQSHSDAEHHPVPMFSMLTELLINQGFEHYCGVLIADLGSEVLSSSTKSENKIVFSLWLSLFHSAVSACLLSESEIRSANLSATSDSPRFDLHLYSIAWESSLCQRIGYPVYKSVFNCATSSTQITATLERLLEVPNLHERLPVLLEFLCCTMSLGYQPPDRLKNDFLKRFRKVENLENKERRTNSRNPTGLPFLDSLLCERSTPPSSTAVNWVKLISTNMAGRHDANASYYITSDEVSMVLNSLKDMRVMMSPPV